MSLNEKEYQLKYILSILLSQHLPFPAILSLFFTSNAKLRPLGCLKCVTQCFHVNTKAAHMAFTFCSVVKRGIMGWVFP